MKTALTIGNFDGIHLGHQALIEKVVQAAQMRGVASCLVTFRPHPVEFFSGQKDALTLFDQESQFEKLQSLGVQRVHVVPFDKKFSEMTAQQFFFDFLLPQWNPVYIVVGDDFRFGRGREGTLDQLKDWSEAKGIEFQVVPAVTIDHQRISTTSIRQALASKDLNKVHLFLGQDFYLKGPVVHGLQRARTLGIPTANIVPTVRVFPPQGTYITSTKVDGIIYPSVTNVGVSPTLGEELPVRVETHILDFSRDIYGQNIQIFFHQFLREERKMSGLQQLKEQILLDIQQARSFHGV
jgi:riboflavin kinase/FMN adenylyltransferase